MEVPKRGILKLVVRGNIQKEEIVRIYNYVSVTDRNTKIAEWLANKHPDWESIQISITPKGNF